MSKKILIVSYEFPPKISGIANYAWEVANRLSEKGHEVSVLTKKDKTPRGDSSFEIIEAPLPQLIFLAYPIMSGFLIKLLRKRKFDHVICNLWLPDGLALFSAAKILRQEIPYSLVVHTMEIIDSNETLEERVRAKLSRLKKQCFEHAQNIFCISSFTQKLVKNNIKISEDKIHIINCGVNPNEFSPSENSKTRDKLVMLTATRLYPHKGVDKVIKAMPTLIKKFPNLEYRIIGEGPDLKRLEKLSEMMNLGDHIQVLGKVSREDLLKNYQQAHLFVMISRKEKHFVEGFGLAFLEAALCGVPSLGGNSGGIPDAILDGQTGWLVDPYNQEGIEHKLEEILSDQEALTKMGEQAREHTLNTRTWDHYINQMMKTLFN